VDVYKNAVPPHLYTKAYRDFRRLFFFFFKEREEGRAERKGEREA